MMKKGLYILVLTALFLIGPLSAESVFSDITNLEIPEGDSKNKNSKKVKKVTPTKTSSYNLAKSANSENDRVQKTTDDNPANSNVREDCTRKGFDAE